jgi:hypothetical protein
VYNKTKNKCSFIAATAVLGWAALAGLLQVAKAVATYT